MEACRKEHATAGLQSRGDGRDANMQTDDARRVLAAWRENLLTDAQVAEWAAEELDATPANDLPEWLLDLCMYGVAQCMTRPSSEFLDVPDLTFAERLAIRVRKLDLSRSDHMEEFVDWVSRACMGEDLDRPEVSFGTTSITCGATAGE